MKWFKTKHGAYIKIKEIIFIGKSDIDIYDYIVHFECFKVYINIIDFIKLKKILKLK